MGNRQSSRRSDLLVLLYNSPGLTVADIGVAQNEAVPRSERIKDKAAVAVTLLHLYRAGLVIRDGRPRRYRYTLSVRGATEVLAVRMKAEELAAGVRLYWQELADHAQLHLDVAAYQAAHGELKPMRFDTEHFRTVLAEASTLGIGPTVQPAEYDDYVAKAYHRRLVFETYLTRYDLASAIAQGWIEQPQPGQYRLTRAGQAKFDRLQELGLSDAT